MKTRIVVVNLSLVLASLILANGTNSLVAQDKPTAPSLEIPATDDGLPGDGPIRRFDWFKNLWNQRRTAWAGRVDKDQKAVVFIGDSITQGWGDDFSGFFPGVKVANRGIGGDTTRGMLIRLKDDVIALNPSCVVLMMGTNDLEEGAAPETIAGNFKLIVVELKKHNANLPIIVCQVFPSSESKKRPVDKIKKLNELYAAAVKGDPQVTLIENVDLVRRRQGRCQAGGISGSVASEPGGICQMGRGPATDPGDTVSDGNDR